MHVTVFIMFVTSLLILFTRGTVPPSLAGLAIAYAASLSGLFQFTLRMLVENEVRFLSVERVNSYMQASILKFLKLQLKLNVHHVTS